MKIVYDSYKSTDPIPVEAYLKNRKLKKYFNRETSGAIATLGKLQAKVNFDPSTIALYYATGLLEYEDYGLDRIVANSLDPNGSFSQERFIRAGIADVSPLNQFKVLLNMPLSFIAIEYGIRGDNAVIYSSAAGLLACARTAPGGKTILIGAGKTFVDGSVACGFAIISKGELCSINPGDGEAEAYLLLKKLAAEAG
jgi:hypothetical protein